MSVVMLPASRREGPTTPGLSTAAKYCTPEQLTLARHEWIKQTGRLTERQLLEAFTEKFKLYTVRGEQQRRQKGRTTTSAKQRAIILIEAFNKTFSQETNKETDKVPTQTAFEVIERYLAGQPQRGPEGRIKPETIDDAGEQADKLAKIMASNLEPELKVELVRLLTR